MEGQGTHIGMLRGLSWIHPGELPCSVFDHKRRIVRIEEFQKEHFEELSLMYDTFQPKAASQELPPEKKGVREKWIGNCINAGPNFVAQVDGRIVAHSMLAPIPPGDRAEFGIFVHQDYQSQQIGTNLTLITICCALKEQFKSLWLCVEQNNAKAIAMYKLAGFKFVERCGGELCMELALNNQLIQKSLDDSIL